jgi:oleate hydratase
MEAVYTLLNVERGVPEVFNSTYDVRKLLVAASKLRDGKPLPIPGVALKFLRSKIDKTVFGDLLRAVKL